ncbi:hypothetical protein [Pedosphaera parvula]|nr:hypothetical protein [Pedosphaera parvula]
MEKKNQKFKLSAKAWFAICLIGILYVSAAFLGGDFFNTLYYGALAISTAGIAAFDSTHIDLRRYDTWLSYGPVGLFVTCVLFFPLAIIWYFFVRIRIARGTMPLRYRSGNHRKIV